MCRSTTSTFAPMTVDSPLTPHCCLTEDGRNDIVRCSTLCRVLIITYNTSTLSSHDQNDKLVTRALFVLNIDVLTAHRCRSLRVASRLLHHTGELSIRSSHFRHPLLRKQRVRVYQSLQPRAQVYRPFRSQELCHVNCLHQFRCCERSVADHYGRNSTSKPAQDQSTRTHAIAWTVRW